MKKAVINVYWDRNFSAIPADDTICCVVTGKMQQRIIAGIHRPGHQLAAI